MMAALLFGAVLWIAALASSPQSCWKPRRVSYTVAWVSVGVLGSILLTAGVAVVALGL